MVERDGVTVSHPARFILVGTMNPEEGDLRPQLLDRFGLCVEVRTPTEILNKPDKLTDSEFAIMRMHVVDGAEILRRTPEMPAMAPVIAFEHHLRLDGTGYHFGVSRAARAGLLVSHVWHVTAAVAGDDLVNSAKLLEDRLQTPKASATQRRELQ